MPLKILFADDSMTAQTMGIKILTEAGYEVVVVSNGSAALKKIAEQKPDIAILDVYMPGYNGLEVCEKMRNSIDTLNTPVLLTVGKMEAYRNEDTNRVKADGLIVKPFEASALVAMVKKLEEQINQPPPSVEHTLYLDRPTLLTDQFPRSEFSVDAGQAAAPQGTESRPRENPHSEMEVPDHMAAAPAFSDAPAHDSSAQHVAGPGPDAALAEQPAPEPSATLPDSRPRTAWKWEQDRQTEAVAASSREASPRETQIMPAYKHPEAGNQQSAAIDFAPEEAAVPPRPANPTTDVEMAGHSVSESTLSAPPPVFLQEHMAVHDGLDPALVTDRTEMTAFATKFGIESPDEVPVGIYAEQSWPEVPAAEVEPQRPADPLVAGSEAAGVSAEDFETRVAAAMTAYDQPEGARQPEAQSSGHEIQHQAANPLPEVQVLAAPLETVVAESELQTYGDAVSTYSAAELPAAAAASAMVADPEVIAQVVHRVLERLKPELIAEIVRELNSIK